MRISALSCGTKRVATPLLFTMGFTTKIMVFLITLFLINSSDAFKRPLFNGSVFGKRTEIEYQNENIWKKRSENGITRKCGRKSPVNKWRKMQGHVCEKWRNH
ncbi:uncharacterized protein LOC111087430 isoform X1 [Limulus polyphemus]|uniref:Uncharacterized protein LOC111087430 isoform X1 n=1 Tax=Limulus polyphemus TaxID=6850 RepID=A0ABM1T1I4_LIMPO|nr:uncharacterized protein LOC111087430 isoform X1 [Limulus polyphemus]